MDSQHRHELKENDLQNAIKGAKDFWGKHQFRVLSAAVLIAGLIFFVRFQNASEIADHENTWMALNTQADPEVLKAVARDAEDPRARAVASMRVANQLLVTAMDPNAKSGEEENVKPLTDEERAEMVKQAQVYYQAAINESPSPVTKFNARLALATIAENQRKWDDAAKQYDAIVEASKASKGLRWWGQQAEMRKTQLARIGEPIIWGKEEIVVPKPPIGLKPDTDNTKPPIGVRKPEPDNTTPEKDATKVPAKDGTKPDKDAATTPAKESTKPGKDSTTTPAKDSTKSGTDAPAPPTKKSPTP